MVDSKKVIFLSPVPLYTQIKEILRMRILDDAYKPHEQIPSERGMTKNFGVSRILDRQKIISALLNDYLGSRPLTVHRVNGHDRRKSSAERLLQTGERLCKLASLLVMTSRTTQLGA